MAGDKLFQKKRERRLLEKKRERKERKEKRRFLVVCEGQTERHYIHFYAKMHEDLVCDITDDCGTSPLCVTECAIKIAENDGDYDQIFAVFDGDIEDRTNFDTAIERIDALKKSGINIVAIHSTPCFEYWLFLHFEYSRKPFLGIRHAKSAGTQILAELKKCDGMESYAKGENLNFPAFAGKLNVALKNAKKAEIEASKDGERNPSTKLHYLHAELNRK